MSLPAREAEHWTHQPPHPAPRRAVEPARPPAARPPIPNLPRPHRRARRGHHPAFWVFTLLVMASMVIGLVSLNAMRVDAAYAARVKLKDVRSMADERKQLIEEVARLSSPSRIGTWARAKGLVHPGAGDVVILQVRGTSPAGARE